MILCCRRKIRKEAVQLKCFSMFEVEWGAKFAFGKTSVVTTLSRGTDGGVGNFRCGRGLERTGS